MSKFADNRITLFRIRQPLCALDYGVSPCAAAIGVTGHDKCFNTTRTCQDRDNLDLSESIDLFFVEDRSDLNLPMTFNGEPVYVIPSLQSVVFDQPARLNVGGGDRDIKAFGTRAGATVTIKDHPHSDNLVDPYRDERNYIATERGTFWSKWLRRNPFYEGTLCDVFDGFIGEDIADMDRFTFIMERINGPNGQVKITIQDILKLADDERAQAPTASRASLVADISDTDTALTVALEAADNFTTAGTVAIGDENIGYNGKVVSGNLVTLQNLVRGIDGTEASAHSEDDSVQWCLRYVDQAIWVVAEDLIETYTPITDRIPDVIPTAEWATEGLSWLEPYRVQNTVIREPTGVNQLLGEIARDAGSMFYWDAIGQKIRLVAVKPSWPVIQRITDDNAILRDSINITRKPRDRINEVWIFYGPRDVSQDLEEPGNARFIRIQIDSDAQSPEEYGDRRIRKIKSRWINTAAHAFEIGESILNRYRDTPEIATVEVRNDAADLDFTDIVDLRHWRYVDDWGNPMERRFQVISVQRQPSENRVTYLLETFPFFGRFAGYMAEGANTFENATEDELRLGGWYSNDDGLMPDGSDPYLYQ